MASSMNDVKYMGYRWGDWVVRGCRGLGYASETAISKLNTSPGRSSRLNFSPDYEPDPIARRFDNALQQIPPKHQNLLYCRFVLQLSDLRLIDYGFSTKNVARRAVERAMREIMPFL